MPAPRGYTLDGSYVFSQIQQPDGSWVVTRSMVAVQDVGDDLVLVDEEILSRPIRAIRGFSVEDHIARVMEYVQKRETGVSRSSVASRPELERIPTTLVLDRNRREPPPIGRAR